MAKRTEKKPDAPALPANKPDGGKACDIAYEMEGDLAGIEMAVNALYLIAVGSDDARTNSALYGIAEVLDRHNQEAEKKRCAIFEATRAYRFPPRYGEVAHDDDVLLSHCGAP